MAAFTTNVEFGLSVTSGRVVFGAPPDAVSKSATSPSSPAATTSEADGERPTCELRTVADLIAADDVDAANLGIVTSRDRHIDVRRGSTARVVEPLVDVNTRAFTTRANTAGRPQTVNRAIAPVVSFRQEISTHLALGADDPTFTDPEAARQSLRTAERALERIDMRYEEMRAALDAVETAELTGTFEGAAGPTLADVRRWAAATGDRGEAQHEQYDISADCLALLPDRAAAGDCYADALQANARRWNATAEKVIAIAAEVFAP